MTMFNEIMDMGLCLHVCIFVKYSNKLGLNLNLNLKLNMLDPFAGERVIWPFWCLHTVFDKNTNIFTIST